MKSKSIFATRFKSARLMNGFSLQDLADALDNKLSRQALHRYEKGEVIPDLEKIIILSKALKVSTDYFLRTTTATLSNIAYNKLNKAPHKEVVMINEQTKDYLSRYLELEDILGLTNTFVFPLVDFPEISEYKQVNEAANTLREQWKLGKGPICNMAELLEYNNIKLIKLDGTATFDGLQTFVNGNIPVIAYRATKTTHPIQIRNTLVCELAHLVLHFKEDNKRKRESLCQQFADALILPEETIKAILGLHRTKLSIIELKNIEKQYGISILSIARRARACGIINGHYTKQLTFSIKQMNWGSDESEETQYTEENKRFEQILFRALSENQITISQAAAISNLSLNAFQAKYPQIL